MENSVERRREQRLPYQWPVWFAEDFKQAVLEGLMVDVSSSGIAFTCKTDHHCPRPGQQLTTRFSIPRSATQDLADMASFTRTGRVCRVDEISSNLRRVAIQFDQPLSLKPCEEASIDLMRSRS
jgi:hypothetical protein